MSAPYLFTPVPAFTLPVSTGQDLYVDFQNQSGNYAEGTVGSLQIDTPTQTVVAATLSGIHATVVVPASTCDTILSKTLWRFIITLPSGVNVVPCNGQVQRFDGKPTS